jgi:hypothetical protein
MHLLTVICLLMRLCCEYQECCLTEGQYILLQSLGIPMNHYVQGDTDWLYVDDFTGLYLAIAKLALHDLVATLTCLDYDNLDIGGYGMCSAG